MRCAAPRVSDCPSSSRRVRRAVAFISIAGDVVCACAIFRAAETKRFYYYFYSLYSCDILRGVKTVVGVCVCVAFFFPVSFGAANGRRRRVTNSYESLALSARQSVSKNAGARIFIRGPTTTISSGRRRAFSGR